MSTIVKISDNTWITADHIAGWHTSPNGFVLLVGPAQYSVEQKPITIVAGAGESAHPMALLLEGAWRDWKKPVEEADEQDAPEDVIPLNATELRHRKDYKDIMDKDVRPETLFARCAELANMLSDEISYEWWALPKAERVLIIRHAQDIAKDWLGNWAIEYRNSKVAMQAVAPVEDRTTFLVNYYWLTDTPSDQVTIPWADVAASAPDHPFHVQCQRLVEFFDEAAEELRNRVSPQTATAHYRKHAKLAVKMCREGDWDPRKMVYATQDLRWFMRRELDCALASIGPEGREALVNFIAEYMEESVLDIRKPEFYVYANYRMHLTAGFQYQDRHGRSHTAPPDLIVRFPRLADTVLEVEKAYREMAAMTTRKAEEK